MTMIGLRCTRKLILLLLGVMGVVLALAFTIPPEVTAQEADATIVSDEALVSYPETVTFRLELALDTTIVAATLHYDVRKHSCVEVSSEVPVEVEGNTLEWTWVMSRSGNPPPGSELWWEWTLRDDAGNTITTPRQTITLEDERFQWRTVQDGRIHLHWYRGETVGPMLLEAAIEGLDRLEQEMGIELEDDVNLYIYGSAEDMRAAVLYIQDWAGGVAFSEYSTVLIGVPPEIAEDWGLETVRHELAHLVLGRFGWSCLGGSRPTWLEEGLASYAEGPADAETLGDIRIGIEENAFVPLRSLNGSFPAHGREAGLAYSQSYSVVAYLLDTYGSQKLQDLILTLAEGAAYDTALEEVYGFNIDGLELAWREAIGAPSRTIPPTTTPFSAADVPTVPPLRAAQSVPTPVSATIPVAPTSPKPAICGLGFVPLLGYGLLSTVLLRTQRGRRKREPTR